MLRRLHILLVGVLSLTALPARAQLPDPSQIPVIEALPSGTPVLTDPVPDYWGRFRPRAAYRYDTGDSIGRTGGLSSFQTFVPVWEGSTIPTLAFLDARFLLFDDQTTPGTNVGLGFRSVVPGFERTVGGHVSYDLTDTGPNTFHQVSGGVESLGRWLDARANFYAPVGRQKRLLGSSFAANNDALFQGQYLMFGGGTQTSSFEYALSGFDTEVGGRVVRLAGLDLRAFVGTYYFGVDNGPDTWGGRARVEARISDTVSLALSVQRDKLFDTTVNLQVALSWPTLSGRRRDDRGPALLPADRLGESIERIQNVVVARGVERVVVPREAALDPLTGAPLVFLHVAPGGNSDGSFENPYASLGKAFADPRFAAGNVIVYDRTQGVYSGNVTLAPGTRLLSAGPVQFVDTLNAGRLRLPFSGADPNLTVLPHVQGTLYLSSGTTVSGFQVSAPPPGVAPPVGPPTSGSDLIAQAPGSLVRDVRVENNVLTGGNIGVNLFNAAGSIIVANNRAQNQAVTGINVQAQHDEAASIRITDNIVGGAGLNGIYTTVNDVMGLSAKVNASIERNTVQNVGNAGISVAAGGNSRLDLSVKDNQVSGAAGSGIEVLTQPGNALTRADVFGNVVSHSGAASAGGLVLGAAAPAGSPALIARVFGNQLTENFTSGFSASVGPNNTLALDLRGNTAASSQTSSDFVLDRFRGQFGVVDLLNLGANNSGKVDVTSAPLGSLPGLP